MGGIGESLAGRGERAELSLTRKQVRAWALEAGFSEAGGCGRGARGRWGT